METCVYTCVVYNDGNHFNAESDRFRQLQHYYYCSLQAIKRGHSRIVPLVYTTDLGPRYSAREISECPFFLGGLSQDVNIIETEAWKGCKIRFRAESTGLDC